LTAEAATAPAAVSVVGVSKTYASRRGAVAALLDVTFRVEPGELTCLVGPSGCGKSTLLKILAGLVEPTSGAVRFGPNGVAPRRAMVFQEHGLFPWMTIADNVAFGLETMGVGKHERRERAGRLLDQLGLGEFAGRFPHELSGGMQQRAAIARALLTDPQVLLMDEPFSALDAQSKLVLQEELLRLWEDGRQTVVYVTHDIEEAVLLGNRVLVMSGRPGVIISEVRVDLPRHRDLRDRSHPELKAKAWSIWELIEGQVRRNLHIPS
jgi:NitT/TauT family transport system ATP-binding protein